MVKRGTPEHPKVVRLAKVLGVRRYVAVGLLEMLWHFTARYAIRGDVGRWSDDEIATALDWDGRPDQLIGALVECRFLDAHTAHRLVVHDITDHADNSWRQCLTDAGLPFWDGSSPRRVQPGRPPSGNSRETPVTGIKTPVKLQKTPQPEPEPEPEPKPEPLLLGAEPAPRSTELGFETFWKPYPKKRHKPAALRAWKAVDGARHLEAILAGVECWKASDQWQTGRIEDPSTFLRQRQWEDAVPAIVTSNSVEGMADRIRKKGLL